MTLQECKQEALNKLAFSDWSELPTVTNTDNTPHLVNSTEWVTYRVTLRGIYLNPVTDPVWPTEPAASWSN